MDDNQTDSELVLRAQRGDKRSFDLLVAKYQYRLQKLVGRYVFDANEAHDVVQEVFIRAYKALPSFQGKSAFYSWLYRIALNTSKNYLAGRARRVPNVDIDINEADRTHLPANQIPCDHDDPEGLLIRDEVEACVLAAVDSLSEDLRTALVLREMAGLSYDEIAQAVQCPVGTVRSRLFRAREAVIGEIQPMLDHKGDAIGVKKHEQR